MKQKFIILLQSLVCILISFGILVVKLKNILEIENLLLILLTTLATSGAFILIVYCLKKNMDFSTNGLIYFPYIFIFLHVVNFFSSSNDVNVIGDLTIPICSLFSNLYLVLSIIFSIKNRTKKE